MYFSKSNKIIFLSILFLSSTLFFGYTADDRQYVLINLNTNSISLIELISKLIVVIGNTERFIPIHTFLYTVIFNYFNYQNAWLYHALILVFHIGACLSFIKWIETVLNETRLIEIFSILITTIQLRITYNDPIISGFFMLQIFAISFFYSNIVIYKYWKTHNLFYIFLWLILISIQLMLYELAIFLIPVSLYFMYVNKNNNVTKIGISISFLIVLLTIYFIVYLIVRNNAISEYSGTLLSINFMYIIKTIAYEAIGSLPLIYAAYLATVKLQKNILLIWSIYGLFLIFLIYMSFSNKYINNFKRNKVVILNGLLLWICSSVSIAFSKRYQEEIVPGLTYVVSYMQNFGFAMCVMPFLDWDKKITKSLIFILIILTFIMNSFIIYEGIKVDSSKRISLELILNNDINSKYNFNEFIINEKILQNNELFINKLPNNLKNPQFITYKELLNNTDLNISINGIILSSNLPYEKSYVLIANYIPNDQTLKNLTLVGPNEKNIQEYSKIYGEYDVKKYVDGHNILFGVNIINNYNLNKLPQKEFR